MTERDKTMRYAEVSVNSPIAQKRSFSYSIPASCAFDSIEAGYAVWVPFGAKTLQGIVVDISFVPSVEQTRDIEDVIYPFPLVSPQHIALARWISEYYLSPLFPSVALMLPPGFERQINTFIKINKLDTDSVGVLSAEEREVLKAINDNDKIPLKSLEKSFGMKRVRKIISKLEKKDLISRFYEIERSRIKPRIVKYLNLKAGIDDAKKIIDQRASKQMSLVRYLEDHPEPQETADLKRQGYSLSIVKSLVEKGLAEIKEMRVDRDPLANRTVNLSFPPVLTAAQESALRRIIDSIDKPCMNADHKKPFLLHGITGSGKTEIYLRVLEEVVRRGRRGIVLVPEISLTPQMIERFMSRFPGRVAVLHSGLTLGEQHDEWWRVKNGEFDVVIGPRSALFAPQPNIGVIILDEEHEWTYKQQDTHPHYHTRAAAEKLSELTGSLLLMGSATPDVESYYKAEKGIYDLLELPERVSLSGSAMLPEVEVVDLRTELKSGNTSVFSRSLRKKIETALGNHEQIILFLNRRGGATFVECRSCGHVMKCRRCDLPLSYHFADEKLICHQCNYSIKVPKYCPECGSRAIKYLGMGTEKLEQETIKAFPSARVVRWDSDTVKRNQHEEIFRHFKDEKADILIGTQMIAKGLDLPMVTVVGVINADTALNMPDFRAGERTFQLLSQVSGRAGRAAIGGSVVIQTYSPDHYSIRAAAMHDYFNFYREEIDYRRELHYPPFARLTRLMYANTSDMRCREEIQRMHGLVIQESKARGFSDVSLIGPAPAYIPRLRSKYRWQMILRAADPSSLLAGIDFPPGWIIDIDPVGLI
jgi:primosomal protein N' (replication factor Y) (superfamily II helicase)